MIFVLLLVLYAQNASCRPCPSCPCPAYPPTAKTHVPHSGGFWEEILRLQAHGFSIRIVTN